ncbi:hypothetical protein F8388_000522 [Cannabis sativa]|uniref:Thiamine pyrophosphate enzyme N-terminal TPP-binding domain-containing protein n=1 Tax=Cannabis sativa TaxID=3483 RepID=A0A7J6EZI4_CANSA|nr:hypothetical protein F8388_000522 [Cannabis sativa]
MITVKNEKVWLPVRARVWASPAAMAVTFKSPAFREAVVDSIICGDQTLTLTISKREETSSSAVTTPTPTTISSNPDTFVSRFGPDEPRKGADVLVEALEREGVTNVFAYPGGASMEIHQALTRSSSIQNVLPRHEQGGIFAAEGYAHSSGLPVPKSNWLVGLSYNCFATFFLSHTNSFDWFCLTESYLHNFNFLHNLSSSQLCKEKYSRKVSCGGSFNGFTSFVSILGAMAMAISSWNSSLQA